MTDINTYRILIVDDDAYEIKILTTLLENEYIIASAVNGSEALILVEKFGPDLILLDWNMPKKSGIEVLIKLKSDPKNWHIPVIMITGMMKEEANLIEAFSWGSLDFIRKPYLPTEIKARIKSVLKLIELYKNEVEMENRRKATLSIQLLEINNFLKKAINQIYRIEKSYSENNPDIFKDLKVALKTKVQDIDIGREFFEKIFIELSPDFYSSLLKRHPDLSPSEIRLCGLLKLNLSSKEISTITNLTVESIKVNRARLRKKINLDTKTNLVMYLMKF